MDLVRVTGIFDVGQKVGGTSHEQWILGTRGIGRIDIFLSEATTHRVVGIQNGLSQTIVLEGHDMTWSESITKSSSTNSFVLMESIDHVLKDIRTKNAITIGLRKVPVCTWQMIQDTFEDFQSENSADRHPGGNVISRVASISRRSMQEYDLFVLDMDQDNAFSIPQVKALRKAIMVLDNRKYIMRSTLVQDSVGVEQHDRVILQVADKVVKALSALLDLNLGVVLTEAFLSSSGMGDSSNWYGINVTHVHDFPSSDIL
mmetsp:Transcript_18154/g.31926  ORF Transcript_18154/g.31926 Transcript_18154/m.31926 type:complete len:259 (+) Transcript_18154:1099-1875(+)